ncbi:hypothetical protein GN956_G7605 [Arapaima gigas]
MGDNSLLQVLNPSGGYWEEWHPAQAYRGSKYPILLFTAIVLTDVSRNGYFYNGFSCTTRRVDRGGS